MSARTVVVASGNPGKVREIARFFREQGDWDVRSLADFPPVDFPEEGGEYEANARAKALAAARATGFACVADDSGIEVDALGGAPGPYSARYGGEGLDDEGRLNKLLEALAGESPPRGARFYCVAACAWPDGKSVVAAGSCVGEILEAATGEGGFGYDPIFKPDEFDRSMAELSAAEKEDLSHRGRAFRELLKRLGRL